MKFKSDSSNDNLKEFIREYYYIHIDKTQEENSGLIADDGCYELMFLKEHDAKLIFDKSKKVIIPKVYTINNVSPPFKVEFPKTFTTFCIKLHPYVNTLFIPNGFPKGVLNLRDVFGDKIYELHDAIFSSTSFDQMVQESEKFLLNLNLSFSEDILLIKEVCNVIIRQEGNISIQKLSEEFNISRQYLNKLFSYHIKHSLKEFSILIRMRASIEYKLSHPEKTLTEIAYQFGYYDQAHFVRDFKKVCGVSPSSFVKNVSYSCNKQRV